MALKARGSLNYGTPCRCDVNGVILKVLAFIVVFIVSSKAEVCGLEQYLSEVYCSVLTLFVVAV